MEKLQGLNNHLNFARVTKNKELEWKLHNNMCAYYHSTGKYEKAKEHSEAHLAIGKEIGDKKAEGIAYGNLGICYQSLSQYTKAIKYQEMRIAIAKDIGDKQGEGNAYGNLGICSMSLGQYTKAIKYQEMRIAIAKDIGDKAAEGSAYGNLGNCFMSLGEYTKAIKYQEMLIAIAKDIRDKQGEGRAYGNLGNCFMSLGEYTKAINYLEILIAVAKDIGDKHGEGSAYGNLGNCYMSLGLYTKAIKYQEMRIAIAKDIGDKQGEGSACNNIGLCYATVGQHDKAESNFRKGMVCHEYLFENSPNFDKFRVSIIDMYISVYQNLIRTLLFLKKRGKALIIAERGRAIALAELILLSNCRAHEVVIGDKVSDLFGICKVAKALESTVVVFTLFHCTVCTWVIQPNGDIMFHEHGTGVSKQSRKTYTETDIFQSVEDLTSLINKAVELMKPRGSDRCEDRSLWFLYPESLQRTKKESELGLLRAAVPSSSVPNPGSLVLHLRKNRKQTIRMD